MLQALVLGAAAPVLPAFRNREPFNEEPYQTGLPAFPYLRLRTGAAEKFEADYQRYVGPPPSRQLWPEAMQAQFLLSTDFFRFNADESRVVGYVGFYDPTVTPSNNPLARFD